MKKVMEIGLLRPETLPQVILEVMKFMEIFLKRSATLPKVIVEVMDLFKV